MSTTVAEALRDAQHALENWSDPGCKVALRELVAALSTPPADDVREALYAQIAADLIDLIGWQRISADLVRGIVREWERHTAAEVRPRGTVTPPADDVRETLDGLTALEAKARAATPGPWVLDGIGKDEPEVNYWAHRFIGAVDGPDIIATSEDGHGPNAEYIAAASPDVVLALIERLRAVEVRPRGTVTDTEPTDAQVLAGLNAELPKKSAAPSLDFFGGENVGRMRRVLREAAREVRS